MARTAQQWIDAYGVCHQNGQNKLIHYVCVPAIMYSILAFLWCSPVPDFLSQKIPWFNWCYLVVGICLLFYGALSLSLMLGMAIISAAMIGSFWVYDLQNLPPLWMTALITFVFAWIVQFIGHKIEGAKPAFFEDVQFLLIGPLWILVRVYKTLGIPVNVTLS